MLEIQKLRDQMDDVRTRLAKRENYDNLSEILTKALEKDDERKQLQTELDQYLAEGNKLSKEIGQLFAQKKHEEANELKEKVGVLKQKSKSLEDRFKSVKEELVELLLSIPNVPHELVPTGKGEEDNEVFKDWSGALVIAGKSKPHWELGKDLDILDFDLGSKITGSGFPVFKGKGARLQRALISFFLDEAIAAGFQEIIPPHLVNADSARATGQLPDKEGQMYEMPKDGLFLIPTSEVPVTNIYRDSTLDAEELPIKMTAYTPCFRREAGSYGADVKGLNRVHQFDKVEIVSITHPDRSYDMLTEMMAHVEGLLQKLELPYRILRLCGGDLGFTSAITYDFEVYCYAQQRWLEVSSVSNFETYQSHRLQLKFREKGDKKPKLAHTLNGSALALARIVAAILENNQSADGTSIEIPGVLRSYTGFDRI